MDPAVVFFLGGGHTGVSPTGVAGVRTPAFFKSAGYDPPEIWVFQYLFFLKRIIFFLHLPTSSK